MVEYWNFGSCAGFVEVLAHQLLGWVRHLVSNRLVGSRVAGLVSSIAGCVP